MSEQTTTKKPLSAAERQKMAAELEKLMLPKATRADPMKGTLEEFLGRMRRSGRIAPEPPPPPKRTAEEIRAINERELLRRMLVPDRFRHFRRHHWSDEYRGRPTPWPTRIDEWTDEWCLALVGPTGAGKTCASVAIAVGHLYRWRRYIPGTATYPRAARFISMVQAKADLTAAYETQDRTVPGQYQKLIESSQFLILDDYGAHGGAENWMDRFGTWLHIRHERSLRTIITANLIETRDAKGKIQRTLPMDLRNARRVADDGVVVEMAA